ncbi:MAG: aldo/keto reductase, partial [Rhodobacteraceae bacterium]
MTDLFTVDGTPIGRFAFGTMQWGEGADPIESEMLYNMCRDAGIIHFDTAHVYTSGLAETLLGRFAAQSREQLFVATKVGYTGGAGRDTILTQFDTSRQRLQMDMVDVLYLHRFDPETALEETIETFAMLREQGKIRYLGLSNFAAWQVMKAAAIAMQFELRISILQPMYSLIKRQAEVEILPMCASEGIAVAGYSPLGSGLLSGKYGRGESGRLSQDERYAARYNDPQMYAAADALGALAEKLHTHPATLAVAWAAHH